MTARLEASIFGVAIVVLSLLLVQEGRTHSELSAGSALDARALYRRISSSQVKLQIIDARGGSEEGYEDTHIPGAIPFAGCDFEALDESVRARIFDYAPTVVVSANGESDVFDRCRRHFRTAFNLKGGMTAWLDAGLPEDSGEYVPPKNSAGGGCL